MHTPLELMCIFYKLAGSNNQLMDFCTKSFGDSSTHTALELLTEKILVHVFGVFFFFFFFFF
jgi:hypothetical protein